METRFYLVFKNGKKGASRHKTLDEAKIHAEKLARQAPGENIYIAETILYYATNTPVDCYLTQ